MRILEVFVYTHKDRVLPVITRFRCNNYITRFKVESDMNLALFTIKFNNICITEATFRRRFTLQRYSIITNKRSTQLLTLLVFLYIAIINKRYRVLYIDHKCARMNNHSLSFSPINKLLFAVAVELVINFLNHDNFYVLSIY